MHIIDWILNNTNPNKIRHKKRTTQTSEDRKGDNADFRHRVCEKCRRVWEVNEKTIVTKNSKTGTVYKYDRKEVCYFEDMPTYGKKREVCPQCKQKEAMPEDDLLPLVGALTDL